jgi:hypothetical protein
MIRALLFAFSIAASAIALAQAPRTIAYQGYLTTTGGVPVNASVEMHFAIYAVSAGGTPVWAESQAVPVTNGVYSVVLGASEPLPDPLTPPLFLGVRIGTDDESAPRHAIAAAPFALFADRARCNPGDIIGCSGAPGSINVGACLAGKRVCNEQGTGYGPCQGQQDPTAEICDNIDNDCDGPIDEDFPDKNAPCEAGLGACLTTGIMVCGPNGIGTVCNAIAGTPGVVELCNGIDDDCDGLVDENFPNKGAICTAGLGACLSPGIRVCSPDGSTTVCNATPGAPSAEVCNGVDDNCDGAVDNGATCSLPNAQSAACLSPQCIVISCVTGFFNCDGNHANGCESVSPCQ